MLFGPSLERKHTTKVSKVVVQDGYRGDTVTIEVKDEEMKKGWMHVFTTDYRNVQFEILRCPITSKRKATKSRLRCPDNITLIVSDVKTRDSGLYYRVRSRTNRTGLYDGLLDVQKYKQDQTNATVLVVWPFTRMEEEEERRRAKEREERRIREVMLSYWYKLAQRARMYYEYSQKQGDGWHCKFSTLFLPAEKGFK
ncbi:unnamed protein product [Cylicocyclus nassatus]|uniref:Uncharacterized protein n=1 Tax=Cylicocyclus nassatus TaxID=53992 RepID=A0AA36M6U0_CYLNA|nr:unnamed protein product [Cylicocyclus nassatus]